VRVLVIEDDRALAAALRDGALTRALAPAPAGARAGDA
jgi:hypothetical protein